MGVTVRWAAAIATALLAALPVSSCGTQRSAPSHSASAALQPRPTSPRPTASNLPGATGPLPGLLLIADRGNNRLLLVDSRKRSSGVTRGRGCDSPFLFRYPDDAFFGPGYHTIISNQEDQDTIQVIAFPSGRLLWHYGHPNVAGSAPGYLDRPDDAYLLPDGTRSVADIANCRGSVDLASGQDRAPVRPDGRFGAPSTARPGSPNGDTPVPGGGLLITEITGSWVDSISARGRLEWAVRTPAAYPSDAQLLPSNRVLLADYSAPGQVFIIDRGGRVLWRYGPSLGDGALDHPSLALPLPGGLVAVNDDYRHRVLLISPRTKRIVWQYGRTDVAGTTPGLLNTPDGLDFLPAAAAAQIGLSRGR